MLVYILKSVACLAIFFVFYKVFLEKENMHVFKRFYLLGALALSMIIPALVFTEYVEVVPRTEISGAVIQPAISTNEVIGVPENLEADVIDIAPILWTIYFLGLLFFGLKFIRNLFQIFRRIRKNPKQKSTRFTKVLLEEKLPPHTFFSYIFLNRKKLESNEIPKEVLLHEETHAQQKHSYDVVLVEFLQVIFWINPLVHFVKNSIKLNHEFLADQAVLKNNIDQTYYQNTLLSYLSPDSEKKYQPMANAINYSSIKKRFTIMKTHTSKKAILLRSFLLLPLITLLLYGFSEIKVETVSSELKTTESVEILNEKASPEMIAEYNKLAKSHNLFSDFGVRPRESEIRRVKQIYDLMNEKQKNEAVIFPDYPQPQKGVNEGDIKKYNSLAKKYNAIPIEKRRIPLADLKILEATYRKMTLTQKEDGQPFPECLPKNKKSKSGASRKLMAEYNALAKKYNIMLSKSKSIQIKMKDVERLEYIYGLMSEKQKADAEPFPDFPPMPEPPAAPKPPKVKKDEKSDIPLPDKAPKPAKATKVKKGEKSDIPPPEKAPKAPKSVKAPKVKKGEKSNILPPTPPEPQSPLDHVVEMAKKGATFYYEGKKITSDKAIELLKKNKNLNINSRGSKSKRPVVKISKAPIVIEN